MHLLPIGGRCILPRIQTVVAVKQLGMGRLEPTREMIARPAFQMHHITADEVRSMAILEIPKAEVKEGELQLARQLVEQGARDSFDPGAYTDEVKARIEEAVQKKVAGQQITVTDAPPEGGAALWPTMSTGRSTAAPEPRLLTCGSG